MSYTLPVPPGVLANLAHYGLPPPVCIDIPFAVIQEDQRGSAKAFRHRITSIDLPIHECQFQKPSLPDELTGRYVTSTGWPVPSLWTTAIAVMPSPRTRTWRRTLRAVTLFRYLP